MFRILKRMLPVQLLCFNYFLVKVKGSEKRSTRKRLTTNPCKDDHSPSVAIVVKQSLNEWWEGKHPQAHTGCGNSYRQTSAFVEIVGYKD